MAEAHPALRNAGRHPGRRRLHRVLDVLGAAAAALLAFTAVPAVLLFVVGNPLSGGLAHTWQPVWRDVLCVVALAAWVAWAACCSQLVRAVVAHVRSGGSAGTATVIDRLAARIALGVLALTSLGGPLALSATAGATVAPHHAGVLIETGPLMSPAVGMVQPPRESGSSAQPTPSHVTWYTVRQGDSLRSIAEDHFADGAEWTSLATLNLGRSVGDGRRFVDPAQLETGWRLRLPAGANRTVHGHPRQSVSGQNQSGGAETRPSSSGHLPEIAALGMGSLVCAGLARRARRRRRPPLFSEDRDVARLLSEEAVSTAALLHRFDDVPALTAFEEANRLLGWALEGVSPAPFVRAAHVTSRGVTFWLTQAQSDLRTPDPFMAVEDGAGWHVMHEALTGAVGRHAAEQCHRPCVPVVFPVGEDDEGTWLVALGPGQVLPVLGAASQALERSLRSAIEAWAWSDTILTADDPTDPVFLQEAAIDASIARHLLYFGSPESLPPAAARRTAIVTTSTSTATDLTLLVDCHGATIHPLGRVVRPHLQSAEVAATVEEILTVEPESRPEKPPAPRLVAGSPRRPAATVSGTAAVTPGTIDVRLLTMTPRLDGLREDLPPNRARRSVELVAYLALHHPDVITSDRLRTRVLGSSDADAAAKTLFNVAHAARRAMGLDDHGAPLLPAGTRNGVYQVSPDVTVDTHRATTLAEEAHTYVGEDASLAIAHFRAALDLVEGEPLANALSGYTWWEAEGHGGRISAVLVDAACTMAALAGEQELFGLARWGFERARLVSPYSEALSRAAMQLAAVEGDTDRLRHEWDECQRRVDELDPGSTPSPRTESLFGQLSRQLLTEPLGSVPRPEAARETPRRYASATSD